MLEKAKSIGLIKENGGGRDTAESPKKGRKCEKKGDIYRLVDVLWNVEAIRGLLNFLCPESGAWEVELRRFFVRLPDDKWP